MKPELPTISWNRPKLKRFKKALAKAPADREVFVFDGHEYLKTYAKYLIEFLEGRLPK